jgi:hypothetical protein
MRWNDYKNFETKPHYESTSSGKNTSSSSLEDKVLLANSLNLESLLADDTFKDVVFKVKEKSFKAHKCIVSRCRYLKEKIEKTQSKDGVLEIDLTSEFDATILQTVLHYLYTQQVKENEVTWELLHAANKLHLNILERKCSEILKNSINEKNVFNLLRESKNSLITYYCYLFISTMKDKDKLLSQLSRKELMRYLNIVELKEQYYDDDKPVSEISLEGHLIHLYRTKEYSDITFKCSDCHTIQAHKAIVFPALKVSTKADVHSVNAEGAIFTIVMEYLYNKNLEFPELYEDPFLMMKLVKCCEKYLPAEELGNIAKEKMFSLLSKMPLIDALRFTIEKKIKGAMKTEILNSISNNASREELIDILPVITELS